MPSPFPGMNPYLEDPFFWREVHNRMIVALANDLGAQLRPRYYAAIETRTYLDDDSDGILVSIPDAVVFASTQQLRPSALAKSSMPTMATVEVPLAQPQRVQLVEPIEVKERFLEVRRVNTHEVVVAIEILSPKNKRGDGRSSYLKKRQAILQSQTHLVEVDLLRASQPMPMVGMAGQHDYRILVSDAAQRPSAELYGFNLRDRIPLFPVPLKPEDAPGIVDLQTLLHAIYDQGNFDIRVDYQQLLPEPDLSESDRAWMQQILLAAQAE
jgi:Protein of unknown function (DUF4058)